MDGATGDGSTTTTDGSVATDGSTTTDGAIVLVDGGIPFSDLPAAFASAVCNHACPEMAMAGSHSGGAGPLPALIAHAGSSCAPWLAGLFTASILKENATAVDAGRQTYSATNAARCIAWVTEADHCVSAFSSPSIMPSFCNDVFVGAIANGGACQNSSDCTSHYCNFSTSNSCGMGTCDTQTTIALGADCSGNGACDPGSHVAANCEQNGSTSTCVGYDIAAVNVALGGACGYVKTGNVYAASYCATGLYCNASNVCATRIALGQPCDNTLNNCVENTICTGSSALTCTALPLITTAGASCTVGSSDTLCDPTMGLVCVPTTGGMGACMATGDGTAGAVCSGTNLEGLAAGTPCATGLTCSGMTSRCVAQLANGNACQMNSDCISNNCDMTGGNGMCADVVTVPCDGGVVALDAGIDLGS